MGVIGFYIRKHIADTPNFTRLKESGGLSNNPLREAFATPEHRRAMLLALFIPLMNGSGYYVLFSYMPTFLKSQQIGFDTGTALLVTAASLVAISIAIPIMGKLSDRVGRKRVIAGAAIAMAIAGVPCYALIVTGNVGARHPRRLHHGLHLRGPHRGDPHPASSSCSPPACATPPTAWATTSPRRCSAAPPRC